MTRELRLPFLLPGMGGKENRAMNRPIIALDAGHGLKTPGKRCMRKLDPSETREWRLNARIMDMVEEGLKDYDCKVLRVDDRTGARDVPLSARVSAANAADADVYMAMHHNAGLLGRKGGGTVVYYCSGSIERIRQARDLYDAIVSRTGLDGNRSQKIINKGFYVIKNTKMPAFLVENGFMDSPTDVPIILSEDHAIKTAQGVVSFLTSEFSLKKISGQAVYDHVESVFYGGLDYSPVFNAIYYADRYKDLKAAYGYNRSALFTHFITNGMKEGRQAIDTFNVQAYRARYPDLQKAFGDNLPAYYQHYIHLGQKEKRIAI